MQTPFDLDIVIPAKNEAESLPELFARLHSSLTLHNVSYRAIVVDDRSTDATASVVSKLSKTYPVLYLLKQGTPGKAQAVVEGAAISTAPYIAMIDADLEYPPEAVVDLYRQAQKTGIAVANRMTTHAGAVRRLASRLSRLILSKFILGTNCDIQSGLKVFKREIISHLNPRHLKPWAIDMPLLHTALQMGYTISQVDIHFLPRQLGISKCKDEILSAPRHILHSAIYTRISSAKTYLINHENPITIGSGVAHKKQRFITHTQLPLHLSALSTLTAWQKFMLILLLVVITAGVVTDPLATAIVVTCMLTIIYFIDVLFNLYLVSKSLHFPPEITVSQAEIDATTKNLPVYSILCPLYKESQVLPEFVKNINSLNWPKNRLEVLLLLEENDTETIQVAQKLGLPSHFKILIVPHSQPKTKPKACNFGLAHAKGEYVVIYDAEDRPDPNQLKIAYHAFLKSSSNIVCLQAKLNYYNPRQNLLTRLFTAEYSLWFDVVLPGLQSINTSIPLGGTSNHFKTHILKNLHGWDAFNVTEDCDLGARLFKAGYKTAIIDSVTLEEANSSWRNWLRQRSRWIKGYIQTFLVHNRSPLQFVKQHGWHALLFQLIVGGKIAFMVINPLLWLMTISYFGLNSLVGSMIESLYPSVIFYMAASSLVFGNFLFLYYYMVGCAKTGHWHLIKYVFVVPIYWLAVSVAALKAFRQLIFAPHYWEKTHHGLHISKKVADQPTTLPAKLLPTISQPQTPPSPLISPAFPTKLIRRPSLFSAPFYATIALFFTGYLTVLSSLYVNFYANRTDYALASLTQSIYTIFQLILICLVFIFIRKKSPHFTWASLQLKYLPLGLLLSGLWLLFGPNLMSGLKIPSLLPILATTPVLLMLTVNAVNFGLLLRTKKLVSLSLIILTESFIRLVVSIISLNIGFNQGIYLSTAAGALTALLLSSLATISVSCSYSKLSSFRLLPKIVYNLIYVQTIGLAFISFDLVTARIHLTPTQFHAYALLWIVGNIVFYTLTFLPTIITPKLAFKPHVRSRHSVKIFILSLISACSVFVLFGVFGYQSAPKILGTASYSIIDFLPIYLAGITMFALGTCLQHIYQFKGKQIPTLAASICLFMYLLHSAGTSFISQQIYSVLFAGVLYFTITLLLLGFNLQLNWVVKNLQALLSLLIDQKPTLSAPRRVLIMNWRDIRHSQAGGAEIYVHEIAKRWAAEGISVTLFCGNDGQSPDNENIDSVNIVRRGGFFTVYLWAFLYYISRFKGQVDAVIEATNGAPFFTPLYVRIPKTVIIYHVNQQVFNNHLPRFLAQIALPIESKLMPLLYKSTPVITISQSSKDEIIKLGYQPANISIVHPGVSIPEVKQVKKTPHPSFVYLGRLKAYKQIDIAIQAFAEITKHHPTAIFTIAGSGEFDDHLKQLVLDLGLTDKVMFTGRISEATKWALLAQSWIAVQPSSAEGWGISVIEANRVSTPVIASNIPGLRDSVLDHKTGLLVSNGSINDMSAAMQKLVTDSQFRKHLGHAAQLWAQNFDWESAAQKLKNLTLPENNIPTSKFYLQPFRI